MVGQWSVNHRHGVMTRLSFQRLHRRKSSVRSYRLLPPSPFLRVNPLCPGTPSPRATAWFLLQESIPWLQESGGFYVKILQKIMARYIYFPPALRLLVALHSSPFPFSYIVLRFSVRPSVVPLPLMLLARPCLRVLSTELPCTKSASL